MASANPAPSLDAILRGFTELHHTLQNHLPMWTVYNTTTLSHPGKYVVRLFVTIPRVYPFNFGYASSNIADIYAVIPRGTIRLPRQPTDHPTIIETWL